MHFGGDYTSSLFNSIRSKKCDDFVFQTPTLNIEYGEGVFFQNQVNRYDKLVDSTKSQLFFDLSSLSTSNNITIMKLSENELINPDDHPWGDYNIIEIFKLSNSALKVYYRNEPAATVTIGSISLHVPSSSFYTPSRFHPATSKSTDNFGTGYLCLDIEYGKSLLSQKQVYDRHHTISSKTKMEQQYRHLYGTSYYNVYSYSYDDNCMNQETCWYNNNTTSFYLKFNEHILSSSRLNQIL